MRLLFLITALSITYAGRAQNVGINTSSPAAMLHIQGSSSTRPHLLFKDSSTYGMGNLRYQNLANNRFFTISGQADGSAAGQTYLDIRSDSVHITTFRGNGNVGIKTLTPAYPLDVNGETNLRNALRVNGDRGDAGQVLTSNGAGAPSWANAALSNQVRFSFRTNSYNTSASVDSMRFTSTIYNLSPADVGISAAQSRIIINRTGLYHLEAYLYTEINAGTAQNTAPGIYITLMVNNTDYQLVFGKEMYHLNPFPTQLFQHGEKYTIDVYLTEGQTLKLTRGFNGIAGTEYAFGYLNGYLISE